MTARPDLGGYVRAADLLKHHIALICVPCPLDLPVILTVAQVEPGCLLRFGRLGQLYAAFGSGSRALVCGGGTTARMSSVHWMRPRAHVRTGLGP